MTLKIPKSITDFLSLCGGNQSEMARRLDVKPQSVQGWVSGKHLPSGERLMQIERLLKEESASEDVVEIPRLDVTASMGPGYAQPEDDRAIDMVRVSRAWLRMNVPGVDPRKLALITACGDSMAETFRDGDVLLVDTGSVAAEADAVYVFALRSQLHVKRLQHLPDGSLLVLSDNPRYREYTIRDERDGFRVLGRILLAWNARRM